MNICPVCSSNDVKTLVLRKDVPVHQNYLCRTEEEAFAMKKADLDIKVCKGCGFGFNALFDEVNVPYGVDYDNSQGYSSVFRKHMDKLLDYLVNDCGIQNQNIIEVGCGKGDFLKEICELGNNQGLGFDPSYAGEELINHGQVKFKKDFYGPGCESIPADVIICRHLIEHIADPVHLLKLIRKALEKSKHARVFFETPCLDWILKNKVFWDFFYEHCSYFNPNSVRLAFENSGFDVQIVKHIFGGQYLWAEAKISESVQKENKSNENSNLLIEYIEHEKSTISHWKEWLKSLALKDKIAIWGAGAKGVTFLNLLDPERKYIDCVIDLNPGKQNKFIPGSAHPIVSHRDIDRLGIKYAIVMNLNYFEENQLLIRESGLALKLLSEENLYEINN
jgi:SAM-dependent methyltransferase